MYVMGTTKAEILASNLSRSGYGATKEELLLILNKLTEDDLEKLTYNMYRTSEKMGSDAFDCRGLYEEDGGV